MTKPTLTDTQVLEAFKRWEALGYEHLGMGNMQDDDPVYCPSCGAQGFFYSLFQHPTQMQSFKDEHGNTVLNDDGSVYETRKLKSYNRCDECGYEWLDEE